jgi:hypothetical protein
VTSDAGQSWKSIASNLPNGGTVRVIREDVKNPSLLFVGTELAAFASLDHGVHWFRLMNVMPTVAVADLVVHPRDGDLIAGTHGRSAYVMDISPLQQLTEEVLTKDLHLFGVEKSTAFRYRVYTHDEFLGEKKWVAENPPFGATISYFVGEEAKSAPTESDDNGDEGDESKEEKAKILVIDEAGETVRELEGPLEPGLHRVQWDLRHEPPEQDEAEADSFRGPLAGPLVRAGVYQVSLQIGEAKEETPVIVESDPELRITQRDLEKRWQTLDRILPLQGDIYKKAKESRSLHEQLEKLEKSLSEQKELPEALGETAEALVGEAELVSHRMNQLNSDITRLYRTVENSPFVPTQMQLDALDGLESRYRGESAALDELTGTEVPELERRLNEHEVPRIQIGSDVKK